MKKIILGISLIAVSLFAEHLNATLKPEKSLTTGVNKFDLTIKDKTELLKEGEYKLKVFMPGMPYMEEETTGKIKDGKAIANINLSMSGTWQYQLKVKTKEGVETTKGSFTF